MAYLRSVFRSSSIVGSSGGGGGGNNGSGSNSAGGANTTTGNNPTSGATASASAAGGGGGNNTSSSNTIPTGSSSNVLSSGTSSTTTSHYHQNNNNNNNNNNNEEDDEEEMSSSGIQIRSPGKIVLSGNLKKNKSMKKKYFVLKAEAPNFPACLEYYNSKTKYNDNSHMPKRSLVINRINSIKKRQQDNKHVKHGLELVLKNEQFNLFMENENEVNKWMDAILLLKTQVNDEKHVHVWSVNIHKKGLGKRNNLHGPHELRLTDCILTLVRKEDYLRLEPVEIPLTTIRRSGSMEHIFYIEVGRSASVGDGELWMEMEDSNIAQNMLYLINNAMAHLNHAKLKAAIAASGIEDDGPRQRLRSSSANEASKPISVLQRRNTAQKLHGFSPLEEQRIHEEQIDPLKEKSVTASAPSQCTQMQTTSTSNTHTATTSAVSESRAAGAVTTAKNVSSAVTHRRRHSVASHSLPSANNNMSQSTHTNATSSSSTTSTTATATVSHQRTMSLPLATSAINQTQISSKRSMLRCGTTTTTSTTGGRDRCDSLPSRARAASESYPLTTSSVTSTAISTGGHSRIGHLLSHSLIQRPHSMHHRASGPSGLSYSPPIGSMPISPASGACSTDSAGSSLSMDDGSENTEEAALSKYGHSLTPDEPVILEENGDDYVGWSAGGQQKFSPNFKSCSPSQKSSYVDMYSPCGSSPGQSGYMPMSPATTTGLHSRTSSLVEESATLPDGYVPMAPIGDDGYIDMEPGSNASHNGHFPDDMSQHGGSSCSVTSGTPSTDARFADYQLEKVSSFLPPIDDLQQARPTRAYSVGSRPDQAVRNRKNNKLDMAQQELSRVRAFSVGSRSKRPEIGRLSNIVTAPLVPGGAKSSKSNSAPLLSSSWNHTTTLANSGSASTAMTASSTLIGGADRMEDLMELDFSKPSPPSDFVAPPPPLSSSQQRLAFTTGSTSDTSSYVDMSPGQQSSTAAYVDMNGPSKINRNNNNSNNNINNNNISTANHNHNQGHTLIMSHKPVITQVSTHLKPVEEQESSYLPMDRGCIDDWSHTNISPKQVSSPCQDDYMQMNGPPGGARTAPMDLPQPRRVAPEGYVEMSFKPKQQTSLDQDYTNMSLGSNRNTVSQQQQQQQQQQPQYRGSSRYLQPSNNNRKKKCSLPIAIQPNSKSYKTPNYLPLSDSPTSESLTSTPASPPRATPTGSSATIFPFSLNSPQSPIKPFNATTTTTANKQHPLTVITNDKKKSSSNVSEGVASTKADVGSLLVTTRKISAQSPVPGVDGCPSFKKSHDSLDGSASVSITSPIPKEKLVVTEKLCKPLNTSLSSTHKEPLRLKTASLSLSQDSSHPMSPITKKLSDLTVSKPLRLMTALSTVINPTATFKPVSHHHSKPSSPKSTSPKIIDDKTPKQTPSSTPTPTSSPMDSDGYEKLQPGVSSKSTTPTLSAMSNPLDSDGYEKLQPGAIAGLLKSQIKALDSEGYEKLQPGATLLHYASLELPEASGLPPVSPGPGQESFNYVEIDFAKSKQI